MKPSFVSRRRREAWVVGAIAGLAACSVGPNYVRPPLETPSAYKEAQGWKQAEPRDEQSRGNWWDVFNDPQLDALVTQVAITNQTIKAAEARVREARALTQAARAAFFPIVTANASATRSGGRGGTSVGGSVDSTGGCSPLPAMPAERRHFKQRPRPTRDTDPHLAQMPDSV